MAANINTFLSKAAFGNTSRTHSARLSDVKNVKDFGAVGDGVADDTAAIQAAVDWTSAAHRGVIFFPPGTYKITAPITFNYDGGLSIIFQGSGNLSTLTGNFAGAILSRTTTNTTGGVRVIRDLNISNNHAAGYGIKLYGSVGASIENCMIGAWRGICLGHDSMDTTIKSVLLTSGLGADSVGIVATNATTIINADITLFEQGVRHGNLGLNIIGGRFEVNTIGIMLGKRDDNTQQQTTGFLIFGMSMEGNGTGIHIHSASGGAIIGCGITGTSLTRGIYFEGGAFTSLLHNTVSTATSYSSGGIDLTGAIGGLTLAGNNVSVGSGTAWVLPSDIGTKITDVGGNNFPTDATSRKALLSGRLVAAGATLTVSIALHDERTIAFNTATGSVVTLPVATGSGARINGLVTVKPTSNAHIVKVTGASDVLAGSVNLLDNDSNAQTAYAASGTDDTLTWNGTTTGGQVGDWVQFEDIAANVWAVRGQAVCQAGSNVADCFSATV
jgi:Pectate lyase superfamily protein